jgi:uncharacterized protein YbjT (DUF2867 family)
MARNILITGATGKTGSTAVLPLLAQGHHVRALVHRVDERSERLAKAGAEVVVGDLHDLDAVSSATKGIDGLYFVHPIAPGLLDATATILQVAEENQVGAIVNMSQISARREAASTAARQHWLGERMLDHFSGGVTHLRPTFFAEWLTSFYAADTDELRLPFADAHHAAITAEDQGRVIAAILADPEPHAGKSYPLYGPVELDHYQIAEIMTGVLGRKINYVPIDLDEFQTTLESRGFGAHIVQHLINVAIDYRNGIFSGTNDAVRTITGADPLTVEAFVERNRDSW